MTTITILAVFAALCALAFALMAARASDYKKALEAARETSISDLASTQGLVEDKEQLRKAKEQLAKVSEDLRRKEEAIGKLEKRLQEARRQTQEATQRIDQATAALKREHELALNKIEHLSTQSEVLTQQLKELSAEKLQLRQDLEGKLQKDLEKRAEKDKEKEKTLKHELGRLQKQIADKDLEIRHLKASLVNAEAPVEEKPKSELTLEQIQELKRRAVHYQMLYKSMKGLKEMADERNQNWETALKALSLWIHRHFKSPPETTKTLGELVSKSLELTHSMPLVLDEFSKPGASALESGSPKAAEIAHEG